ncbi:biotin transport system substrate-specific component [Palleronia marisminoris]|uniref:Biotin transporter n=1 Tax=Palleronia marisminoris TaxID=315423 RepID=A0A1Y5RSI4_9RHOB|nr:biotin transporter BioY [Palleronia marisminoris]SFG51340.1 biotin transport system substrate-specific component [Palleronia marisminoris]SLN24331.1 Biotin transporter BioY [Palleronia marisminoris]
MTYDTPLLRGRDLAMWQQAALVLAGTVLIALAAQVSVPMWPVPMTLQGAAIIAVGLSMGSRLAAVTLLTYLAEGAMGLPVFANGGAGLAYIAGPTGGFLIGFVMMAWVAGLGARAGKAGMLTAALVAAAVLYMPGLAWPYAVASGLGVEAGWAASSASALWAGWMQPFLIGDAVKAVLAVLVVAGGRSALSR